MTISPVDIRLAHGSDRPLLERMLLEAVNWAPDRPHLTIEELRENDLLARYLDEWPGVDDAGVVAEEGDSVIGAAGSDASPAIAPASDS